MATLLRSPRFWPLCLSQACSAFNDNLVKNALAVLALFRLAEGGELLVQLGAGLFIAPYALLSATAGQLADRLDKARLIRAMKWAELALMLLAAAGFLLGNVPLLLATLVGLGAQAAFFSPLKYGILPDLLPEGELVAGNGLVEAATFLAILAGTIAGGALVLLDRGAAAVSGLGVAAAVAGLLAAARVPAVPARSPGLRVGWNLFGETVALLRGARAVRPVWLASLGLSWFWTVGAVLIAEFQVVAKAALGADQGVVTLFLTVFSVGIGAGSLLCARLLRGEVSARYVPLAALGISLFTWDFARACAGAGPGLGTARAVLSSPAGLRVLLDLLLLALCGGLYSVPLYAVIQERSNPAHRSRMIGANNVLNAALIVLGVLAAAALSRFGLSATGILMVLAAANLLVAAWIVRMLPQDVTRMFFRWYFRLLHGATVRGLEHYPADDVRAVVVVNHQSFQDGVLVAASLPGVPVFAVNTHTATRWWARLFLAVVDIFPVDATNPYAARAMIHAARAGRRLVIFPEGRITTSGGLMKVYDGAALVADKADALIVPVRIEGAQFSPFSRMGGKLRRRWFPRLRVTVLPPVRPSLDPSLAGRARRQAAGAQLQALMVGAAFSVARTERSLFAAVLDARETFGGKAPVLEDTDRRPIGYDRLVLGACVLGRALAREAAAGEAVGVLLPNAIGAVATITALQAFGRVPAMLNHTAGAEGMLSACAAARVRTVLTSRRFVERGKLDRAVAAMAGEVRFVWLEDVRARLGLAAKLRGLLDRARARRLPGARAAADAPAFVLFTSGSEGTPKGVVLSHRNLLANVAQVGSVIDFSPADRVLNAMPMFHAFGLTGGTLLPLLNGIRTFHYPSPLHYRVIPELAYDTDATAVFGTDTFLAGWARYAHPFDFRTVRYVVAGAERVRDETRRTYADRFGVRILEGYGVTEGSPVLAVNTPMHNRPGTVGRLLPGIERRLDPVPGIADGGRLVVRGPNVMLGYLRATAPGVLEPPPGGWYDTGDIVSIDADGFVSIRGRVRRFAKIAGEMVSMAAAEGLAAAAWPDGQHAVVAVPDARKGEALLLVTTRADADVRALLAAARARGVPEIAVPRLVRPVERLPLLGTGKVDYPAVQKLAEAVAAPEPADAE